VKEEESGTLEAVQAIQSTTLTLQKAKDAYTQKGLEFDKLKKENASAKDLEKAEAKLKKAQEDYKNLVDKYSAIKEDFEKKMSLACKVKRLRVPLLGTECCMLCYVHLVREMLIIWINVCMYVIKMNVLRVDIIGLNLEIWNTLHLFIVRIGNY
jgi:hypothetical protein